MSTYIKASAPALKKAPFYNDNKIRQESFDNRINLSDREIDEISKAAAIDCAKNSKAAKAQKILYPAIIGTFITSNVIAKKGPASSKLATAAIGILSYAVLNASINGAVKMAEKTAEKTGKDKENARDVAYLGSIAGFALLYKAAMKGVPRVTNTIIKKFPDTIKQTFVKNRNKFDNGIKNSKITNTLIKYIAKPAKSLVTKFPKISKFISQYLGIIGIAAYVSGSALLTNKILKDTNKAYSDTKSALYAKREELEPS